MRISQTRLKKFWQNPEAYRLQYVLDLVPSSPGYALQRGSVFHAVLNLKARGETDEHIANVLRGTVPDYDGRMLVIQSEDALRNGVAMAEAYINLPWAANLQVVETEKDFNFQIPGSPHFISGRIDQIVTNGDSVYILEFKTASSKQYRGAKEADWANDIQADFEFLGAESLDIEVDGLQAQYVIEARPPKVWEPIFVSRTKAQLERTKLFAHQTCETILMYENTFGPDQPWPHLNNWPCNGDKKWCDYRDICQCSGEELIQLTSGPEWAERKPSPFEEEENLKRRKLEMDHKFEYRWTKDGV